MLNMQWGGLLAMIICVVDFFIADPIINVNVTDANFHD